MGTTNDEAYLCLKALAFSVRRNKSLILPLIGHVIHNKEKIIRMCITYVQSTAGLFSVDLHFTRYM